LMPWVRSVVLTQAHGTNPVPWLHCAASVINALNGEVIRWLQPPRSLAAINALAISFVAGDGFGNVPVGSQFAENLVSERLRIRPGVVNRHLNDQGVMVRAAETFDQVQLVAVRTAGAIEPG